MAQTAYRNGFSKSQRRKTRSWRNHDPKIMFPCVNQQASKLHKFLVYFYSRFGLFGYSPCETASSLFKDGRQVGFGRTTLHSGTYKCGVGDD